MEKEQNIIYFIQSVFECQHLKQEFNRFFEGLDGLTENLDTEERRNVLVNARRYLEVLARKIEQTEQRISAQLPQAMMLRDQLTTRPSGDSSTEGESINRHAIEAYRDTWDAPAAPEASARYTRDSDSDSWDALPAVSEERERPPISLAPLASADDNFEEDDLADDDLSQDEVTLSPPFSAPSPPTVQLHGDSESDGTTNDLPVSPSFSAPPSKDDTSDDITLSPPFSAPPSPTRTLMDSDSDIPDSTSKLPEEVLALLSDEPTKKRESSRPPSSHVDIPPLSQTEQIQIENTEAASPPEDA